MTVQELYDYAKARNLLDKQIAKHFNFNIEDIRDVSYLCTTEMKYLNETICDGGRIVLD